MRFLRIFLAFLFLVLIFAAIIYFNADSLKLYFKTTFGGVVVNNTLHTIKVADGKTIKTIPAKMSSREAGVFDVDFIIIEEPSTFNHNQYSNGVIKICDFASIEVSSKDDITFFSPVKLSFVCNLVNDMCWDSSLDNFFP